MPGFTCSSSSSSSLGDDGSLWRPFDSQQTHERLVRERQRPPGAYISLHRHTSAHRHIDSSSSSSSSLFVCAQPVSCYRSSRTAGRPFRLLRVLLRGLERARLCLAAQSFLCAGQGLPAVRSLFYAMHQAALPAHSTHTHRRYTCNGCQVRQLGEKISFSGAFTVQFLFR